jgi:hypothetical protein
MFQAGHAVALFAAMSRDLLGGGSGKFSTTGNFPPS